MNYAVVIEQAGKNFSAYIPDLPGCVATGATVEECQKNIQEAFRLHIKGMLEDKERIPENRTRVGTVMA